MRIVRNNYPLLLNLIVINMSVSNGKITAPVSIDDIKSCFRLGSNDLGTLIKTANINIWAKY